MIKLSVSTYLFLNFLFGSISGIALLSITLLLLVSTLIQTLKELGLGQKK